MRVPMLAVFVSAILTANGQSAFPDRCAGIWEGTMQIYSKGVLRDSVRVRRTIQRIDDSSWTWKTQYLSEKMPATKDYIMRRRETSLNEYVIDEGGGIEIPMYLTGDRLYSVFETSGILLTAAEELRPDGLLLEVVSTRRSGRADAAVATFQVLAVQRVLLVRRPG